MAMQPSNDFDQLISTDVCVADYDYNCDNVYYCVPWWRGSATGRALDFAISRLRVQILLEAMLRNNIGQIVYTYVPLSPSSITWYWPKGGDALRLGR